MSAPIPCFLCDTPMEAQTAKRFTTGGQPICLRCQDDIDARVERRHEEVRRELIGIARCESRSMDLIRMPRVNFHD